MIREVLKMGDPRLLEKSRPVEAFGTPQLRELVADMHDTMAHLNGAGLAAPQIGVPLRVVIFGVTRNPRYPDAEEVPDTVLINPVITPIGEEIDRASSGCATGASTNRDSRSIGPLRDSMHAWSNTNTTTSTASCIRCASSTCRNSVSPRSSSLTRI